VQLKKKIQQKAGFLSA